MIGVVQPPAPSTDKWLPGGHDRSFFDTYKSLLQQQRESRDKGGDGTSVETPKLNDLTRRLGIQFERVFGEIALTQRRGILHRSPLTLHSDCDQGVTDLTFCYEVGLRLLNSLLLMMLTCAQDAVEGQPCSIYVATRSATSKHQGSSYNYS
jgi:anaphase-promoting complex subunit 4